MSRTTRAWCSPVIADGPEHSITYINLFQDNEDTVPSYGSMSMLGMTLRSGRNIQQLDQLRVWLPDGIPVRRWLDDSFGPSNHFTDLLYYLLTDKDAGAGDKVPESMIDQDSFRATARFLDTMRIRCDMVLEEPFNIRAWATEIAPLLLCQFLILNGRFAITPALPVTSSGAINATGPVPVKALFAEGNIITNSFEVTYLSSEERAAFKRKAPTATAGRIRLVR